MKVCIRADGGPPIGWGHLSRCRALALVLEAGGAEVHWACRASDAVTRFLGHPPSLQLAGPVAFEPLGRADADAVAAWASDADWLVVDHYGADAEWLQRASGPSILLAEDHQVRRGATLRLAPMQEPAEASLTGVEHLLMHPAFAAAERPASRQGVVACFGGAAPPALLSTALAALPPETPVTVIAPDAGLDTVSLARLASPNARHLPWIEPPGMAALFAGAGSALVSSTVMAFEALAVGCPVVALEWVDNQARHATTLRGMGVPVETTPAAAGRAVGDGRAGCGHVHVDGQGSLRVARAMGLDV